MSELDSRIEAAIATFDALNAADPTLVELGGQKVPRELARAEQLSTWVSRVEPNPSVALRLAARCQHLMRWKVTRSSFPAGRAGYHQWRRHAAAFHAEQARRVLTGLGWDDDTVSAVERIVQKRGLATDPDVKTMEDALCLAFIESDLEAFAKTQPEDKLASIVRDTWRKMSPRGRSFAPPLLGGLSPALRALVERVVASSG